MTPTAAGLRPAVFLDRDGVLIEPVIVDGRPNPPASAEAVVLVEGAARACQHLRSAGLPLVVVTNQPDIARGTQSRGAVDAINAALRRLIEVDAILVCPHDDADGCACRKPRPGMLLEAATQLRIDLARSVMVGDRWRDIEAGRRAGCRTVLVRRGYDEPIAHADLEVGALSEAIQWIVQHTSNGPAWRTP